MNEIKGNYHNNILTVSLSGRIDSGNAPKIEEEMNAILDEHPDSGLIIDMSGLEYISSAGLRILLRIRKRRGELHITEAGSEVYEVLEMTGFTQMMTVEKAYRTVSIEGCEVIGQGANGTVYRIDGDNVVKVYNDADALDDIHNEREVARLALVLGIPTAISYDVVRVGDSYGSVFELLDATSFSKILAEHPEKMDWCVREYVELLKKIHGTVVPEGKLPDMRQTAIGWARFMQDHLPEDAGRKLLRLIEEVPADNHMIHGDYHTKNIQLAGGEVLLIDMDTLATGHPVFEFASMYNAFQGFGEADHSHTGEFMGIDFDTAGEFWRRSLAEYFGTDSESRIREVEDKARIIGYTRMIRRSIRRDGLNSDKRRAEIELWTKNLLGLLGTVDSLLFNKDQLQIKASVENLHTVMDFLREYLDRAGCPSKTRTEIELAAEEIFINIANYAYAPGTGDATIGVEISADGKEAVITFTDQGIPYNPLEKKSPDVTLPAHKREIGGLGIFITKKIADDMQYEYKDGYNILTFKKRITEV